MPLRISRRLFAVTLLVASGFVPDARAQLPIVAEPELESEPAPTLADPSPPTREPESPRPDVPSIAPAKTDVIAAGQHPYDDEDDEDERLALAPRRVWYGWQTLLVDGVSVSAFLLGAAFDERGTSGGAPLVAAGLLSYGLAPGIVHFAHRNPGRGFASFGVRLGMPLAGAFLGASLSSNCDGSQCEGDAAAVGLLLGMAGAIAIDAAVFAYDDRRPRPRHPGPRLMPLASLVPGRAWIGVGGEL